MKTKFLLANVVIGLSLVSCGGGGGGSAPEYTLGEPKIFKKGDTFVYDLTGYIDTDPRINVNGTLEVKITKDNVINPKGIPCKEATYTYVIALEATDDEEKIHFADTNKFLFYQGNDGIYYCGEFDEDLGRYKFITNFPDGLILSNTYNKNVGDVIQYREEYDDGSWEECTYNVEKIEYVNVPYGKVQSYKLSGYCEYDEGTVSNETMWDNLSIAPFIKGIGEIYEDGQKIVLEMYLKSVK